MNQKIAFVMSGGGNHGALQVGALRALLEHGVMPTMVVGTSAGALNAAYFAARPTMEGIGELERIWCRVTTDDVYPGNRLQTLWRLLSGSESIFPNDKFQKFLLTHLPPDARTFRDLQNPQCFITATHLDTCDLHLYGENPDESVLEAVMSSTALPPFSPPWKGVDGRLHVDGGSVSDLPLTIAMKKGAKEIYALHITEVSARDEQLNERARSMAEIGHAAVRALLKSQVEAEIAAVKAQKGVAFHHLQLAGVPEISFRDFSHGSELIKRGYAQTCAYLEAMPKLVDRVQQARETLEQLKQKAVQTWREKSQVKLPTLGWNNASGRSDNQS